MKICLLIASFVLSACAASPKPTSIDRVPAGIDSATAAKIESDLIRSAPKKKITREKDQLVVTLKNKKTKAYKDDLTEGSEKYIRHVLVDYVAKHDVAVIQQLFYEGGQFLVVSLKDGSEIITPTKPVWSPEKSNFISVNDDESDYTENVVVIGSCNKMKCAKVFSEKTHSGAEKWLDEKTVEFEKRKFDPGTGKSEVQNFTCKIEKKTVCTEKK